MRIVWDEPKRRANIDKHGLDFRQIEDEFDCDRALIVAARPSRIGRERVIFGEMSEERVVIVASPLGNEALSIVSLRSASERERMLYAGSR
jgi:uncharacterized protein